MNKQKKEKIVTIVFFVFAYVFLFLLPFLTKGIPKIPFLSFFLPLPKWISPMYFVVPLAGLVFFYYLLSWAKKYFEVEWIDNWVFPVTLLVLSFASYYFVIYFYYLPSINVINAQKGFFGICFDDLACQQLQETVRQQMNQKKVFGPVLTPNYSQELKSSPFIYFVFAGLLAWSIRVTTKKLKEEKII